MTPQNSDASSNNNPTNDAMKVKDQAFTIPRATLVNGKDNYSVTFESMNQNEMNKANAKPFFIKRILGKKNCKLLSRSFEHACGRVLAPFSFYLFSRLISELCGDWPKNSRV